MEEWNKNSPRWEKGTYGFYYFIYLFIFGIYHFIVFNLSQLFQDIMVFVLQAEKASWNSIGIFKISNVSGKRRELLPSKPVTDDTDMDSDSSDSDEDGEGEEDGGSKAPVLQVLWC